jgi:hypothetical protein
VKNPEGGFLALDQFGFFRGPLENWLPFWGAHETPAAAATPLPVGELLPGQSLFVGPLRDDLDRGRTATDSGPELTLLALAVNEEVDHESIRALGMAEDIGGLSAVSLRGMAGVATGLPEYLLDRSIEPTITDGAIPRRVPEKGLGWTTGDGDATHPSVKVAALVVTHVNRKRLDRASWGPRPDCLRATGHARSMAEMRAA